jgi:O-antigen ligase
MPDISFFEFWQFLPHNAFLWVWVKTGFFGFVSMLYLFGRTISRGARTALRVRSADDAAMVTACLAYAVMFLVFAYVDIAWGVRPAVFLAVCLAICADAFDVEREGRRPVAGSPIRLASPVRA